MTLSEQTKQLIQQEYDKFKSKLYAGKSLEERKELDQFFTPPSITIPMIEKFDCDDLKGKKILDPTCGSGNLLVACLIAGAKLDNLYGNDYDADMVDTCRERLANVYLDSKYNQSGETRSPSETDVVVTHIHRGNALQKRCVTDFSDGYNQNYREKYIDDLLYGQGAGWIKDNSEAKTRADMMKASKEELW